jgi:hypothetical protein
MGESTGIFVTNIPPDTTKTDLELTFTRLAGARNTLSYVLFPLEHDSSRAYVQFNDVPENLFTIDCSINGHVVSITPADVEVYSRCWAHIDALVVATIPNVRRFIEQLQNEFAVRVDHDACSEHLTISGSMLQLTCAQSYVRQVFGRQRDLQHRHLSTTVHGGLGDRADVGERQPGGYKTDDGRRHGEDVERREGVRGVMGSYETGRIDREYNDTRQLPVDDELYATTRRPNEQYWSREVVGHYRREFDDTKTRRQSRGRGVSSYWNEDDAGGLRGGRHYDVCERHGFSETDRRCQIDVPRMDIKHR